MKIVPLKLFFLLLFCAIAPAKAQYQSIFGQNSTEWLFDWSNLGTAGQDTAFVFGDTVLNGLSYKMITFRAYAAGYDIGLLREDTTEGKVWYRTLEGQRPCNEDTIDQLLFNFSLNLGDTFIFKTRWSSPTDTIKVVDSVYYDSYGRKCIRIGTWAGPELYTMIEGLGSNYGVMTKHCSTSHFIGQYLLCYHRDTVQMYLNNYYGTCLVHDGSPNSKTETPNIRIYPNPVQDYLYIDNPYDINIRQLVLINSLRQEVFNTKFRATIDLEQLPKGFYYLQLRSEQKIIHTEVLIKR